MRLDSLAGMEGTPLFNSGQNLALAMLRTGAAHNVEQADELIQSLLLFCWDLMDYREARRHDP